MLKPSQKLKKDFNKLTRKNSKNPSLNNSNNNLKAKRNDDYISIIK